ncbi:MAG: sugar kinase [Candidatus Bipolaricaulia bacterium]
MGQDLKSPGIFMGPYPSGAPVIFAGALSKLGVNTSFIGSVGNDAFGKVILTKLKEDGVKTVKTKVWAEETTGVAFVAYFEDGSRKFIYHVSQAAAGKIGEEQIEARYLQRFNHLHVMGTALSINEDWQRAVYKAAQVIKNAGGKISFDPNLRPEMLEIESVKEICFSILDLTDIFLPGEQEISVFGDEDELLEKGIEVIAIKRGSRGSTIVTEKETIDIPPFEIQEVDPTGAGDCYDAGFIKGYYEGWDWKEMGRFANAVGALAVTQRGPMEGAPTFQETIEFIGERL